MAFSPGMWLAFAWPRWCMMAGLVPIQVGTATNGKTGPTLPVPGDAEPVTVFADVLSGFFALAGEPKVPLEPVTLTNSGSIDPDNSLEPNSVAAQKPSGSGPLVIGNGRQAVAPKAAGSALFDPVPGKATTPLVGQRSAVQPNNAPGIASTGGAPTAPVPQAPESATSSLAAPRDGSNLDSKPQSPFEAAAPVPELRSDSVRAMPPGNTRDYGTHDLPTAAVVPTAASGNHPERGSGTHIGGNRRSGGHPVSVAQALAGHGVPDVGSAADESASQPPVGAIGLQIAVPSPPTPDPTVAAATQATPGVGDKPADPRPSAPVVAPGNPQQTGAVHSADGAAPPALSLIAPEAERMAVKGDAVPGSPALPLTAEVPQASAAETVASPILKAAQPPPVAPADQVAPALVGILQKTDGQQSVTIRLQPVELGQVQIRVDQNVVGAAHIAITAERPETLQLLQRDEPRIQQVLDQAGVSPTGRTVSFQVSAPEQIGATASRPDSMETGAGASGQGQSGGAWRQNGDTQNDFGRSPDPNHGQDRPRWFRPGLDITA
jgi:hypothetical protein